MQQGCRHSRLGRTRALWARVQTALTPASMCLLLLLAACSPAGRELPAFAGVFGGDEPAEPEVTENISDERTVTPVELDVAYVGQPSIFDPMVADSPAAFDLVENLLVGLTNFDHQTSLVKPELASSWNVSPDGLVWTFQLRDDIYWVQGIAAAEGSVGLPPVQPVRPVLADDIVFGLRRTCSSGTEAPYAFLLFQIAGCRQLYESGEKESAQDRTFGARAAGDHLLEITLTAPASHFLTLTSTWLFHPLPRDLVENSEEGWMEPENLVTSGPFALMSSPEDEDGLTLGRNDLWPLTRGGNVDQVNIQYLDSEETIYELWWAKELDVSLLPASEIGTGERTPATLAFVSDSTVYYLGFNFESSVFRETEVRQAFSAAIDRNELIEQLFPGQAIGMRHISPPGVVGAPPLDHTGVGYSPDFARQKMSDSNFGHCKLMPPITFQVSASDLSLLQAEIVRDMLVAELGCDPEQITIEQVPLGTLLANTRADAGPVRPDMWELAWSPYYADAQHILGDLLNCQRSENRQERPCSEVDELIDRAARTTEPAERNALFRDIENLFFGADGLTPVAPLYVRGRFTAIQPWLEFTPAISGGEQFDTYRMDFSLKQLEQSRR